MAGENFFFKSMCDEKWKCVRKKREKGRKREGKKGKKYGGGGGITSASTLKRL